MLSLPFEPPIQQLELPIFSQLGLNVFVKREDTIHPFISGNKWRKLKYLLADAKQKDKTILVSFGGAYSNHLVALACAGAMHGFSTIGIVRGEKVNNHMLQLCQTWGMVLFFVSREAYNEKQLLFANLNLPHSYFIDEGGKGELAMKGCMEILKTVNGFSHVICSLGTGTTFAGLAQSAIKKGMKPEAICVLKGATAINNEVAKMIGSENNWIIHHQFHGGGYAKTTTALWTFIDDFAKQTGILLDQIYTAKMMQGVIQLAQQQHYKKGDKLLLIHTGGLLGLLSRNK